MSEVVLKIIIVSGVAVIWIAWFSLAVILELRDRKRDIGEWKLMKFLRDKAKPQEAR